MSALLMGLNPAKSLSEKNNAKRIIVYWPSFYFWDRLFLLSQAKKEAAIAFPSLEEALKNKDPYTRMFSLRVLRKLARFASRFVPALLNILTTDSDASVRADAAEALGLIAWHNKMPLPGLEIGLQDSDELVRASTAKGLAFMKHFAKHALPKLQEISQTDTEGDVRVEAETAIEIIEGVPGHTK
ncbi:MAG: HEAT repeat domain-containing protein [Deltaproteobacteria bacterium]|nr:HEAT repeat domain-containing protein [Deltaproteobacteria bacterium]